MARTDAEARSKSKKSLSRDLLHGLSPDEFNQQAQELAAMAAMTPTMRARLRAQLIERLKTPVDKPSWGPDWKDKDEKVAGYNQSLALSDDKKKSADKAKAADADHPVLRDDDDDAIIARNMEKSRQVAHYKPLYIAVAGLATAIVLVSMFVDYHIIREIWTRALANEFMVVPPALQASVMFKSLQVVFAVLIVHFMLKLTGKTGRAAMITASFVMAMVMISGLGYLVAYNNMAGGTATAQDQTTAPPQDNPDSIKQLFAADNGVQNASMTAPAATARVSEASEGVSLGLPKLSERSLAHADRWFWLAFASVVFFIVTTVAALYMQTVENNVRNTHIAKDYQQRRKDFALLHLLELESSGQG